MICASKEQAGALRVLAVTHALEHKATLVLTDTDSDTPTPILTDSKSSIRRLRCMPLLDAAGLGPLAEATTDGGEVSVGSGFSICLRVTVVCKYVPESDRTQARRRPAQYATAKWDREVIIGVDTFHDHGATIVGYYRIRADAVRATLAHTGEGGVFINNLARDAHVAHTHQETHLELATLPEVPKAHPGGIHAEA